MKFYVASYVGEIERVRQMQRRLRELGHEITADWTAFPGVAESERNLRAKETADTAVRDLDGVRNADVFVLLAGVPDGRAKYVELGAALLSAAQNGKPRIYVIGDQPADSVFFFHPLVKRLASIDEVLRDLGEPAMIRRFGC